MRPSRTHFEQIPLEVVKKIAEKGISKDEKIGGDSVIVEQASRKGKAQTVPARSPFRKRR